jgi:plasmid stabilization system protein ParE
LRPSLLSFIAHDYVIIHSIADDDMVLILHVVHGSRDLAALLGN